MKNNINTLFRCGLGSLRGRYLYAAALLAVFLIGAAVLGQHFVTKVTEIQIGHARVRAQAGDAVRTIMVRVRDVETAVQRFVILPEAGEREAVLDAYSALSAGVRLLQASEWHLGSPEIQRHTAVLAEDIRALKPEIERMIEVRTDVAKWFAPMDLITNRLLPDNAAFYPAAAIALDEAYTHIDQPGQARIFRLFSDARYAWTQMTSEFRLFIANRFGLFSGDAQTVLEGRVANIGLYVDTVTGLLDELTALDQQEEILFEGSAALEEMRRLHASWQDAYGRVLTTLNTDRWRTDLPLLKETIDPRFERIRASLHELQETIETATTDDLTGLTDTASRLSRYLWLTVLVSILVTIAGFALFQRGVLVPIARVAKALRSVASGDESVAIPTTSTEETRDLTVAFDQMREQVRIRQQRLEDILDNAAEGIMTIRADGTIESFNTAAEKLFGFDARDIIGRSYTVIMPSTPSESGPDYISRYLATRDASILGQECELNAKRKNGTTVPISLRISETAIQNKNLLTALVADISERQAMVENLRRMAEHDGLTGLYNRNFFQNELELVVERVHHRRSKPCSLLYVDLDNFKYVNDTMGHAAGDKLLVEVAGILRRRGRRGELIARFGGDEFVVLLYDTTPESTMTAAEAFRRQITDYVFASGTERVDLRCSVGIAMIDEHTRSSHDVLAQADLACHLAKRHGRNQIHMFNTADDEQRMATMSLDMGWSRRIKEAIEHDRFTLVYQPIISTRDGRVESYEVLVRMLDEVGEHIMPSGFLPSAERFGLTVDIDRWVISRAIENLSLQRRRDPALRLSINLSAQTLSDSSVCGLIAASLQNAAVAPDALTFEVTETAAIGDMRAARTFLSTIKHMGGRTALDDFGSGFASFAYLKDLPIDLLKVDGRYIRELATNRVDQAMVKAMNDVAHAMGLQTVAEFVESEESLELLNDYGIDFAQGYHIGPPAAANLAPATAKRGLAGT